MEENKSNLMAKIALRLEKIKELMQEKGFTHFYIPDQFNYDASVDDFFEEEIRDDEKTVFAGYREFSFLANVRYTINGIYLENGELSFDARTAAPGASPRRGCRRGRRRHGCGRRRPRP